MSRLIVVSNRVADLTKSVQSGGLAVALADALREHRGIWFGWDGTVVSDAAPIGINLTQQHHVRTATVPLTQRDYDEYYVGFSNNVLWPSFHYRLDLGIIDGVVNGVGRLTRWLSGAVRGVQTGYVRTYAITLLLGVVIVIVVLLLPLLQTNG